MMTIAGATTGMAAIYASHGHLPKLNSLGETAVGRATGPFSQPNTLAMFLAMAMICALASTQVWRGWARAAAVISVGLCIAGMVLSLSRGGFVAVGFGLLPLLWWRPLRRTILSLLIALVLIVIAEGAAFDRIPVVGTLTARLSSIALAAHGQNPRWQVWGTTLHMIRDHWFGGIGTYQFPFVSLKYGLVQPQMQPYSHAHNFFLTIIVERGWLGLLAIVLGLWLLPRVLRQASSASLGENRIYGLATVAALLTFFAKGMFDYDTGNNLIAAMLYIFCACATVMAAASSAPAAEPDAALDRDGANPEPDEAKQAEPVGAFA
jgi:O-antigen ligase